MGWRKQDVIDNILAIVYTAGFIALLLLASWAVATT